MSFSRARSRILASTGLLAVAGLLASCSAGDNSPIVIESGTPAPSAAETAFASGAPSAEDVDVDALAAALLNAHEVAGFDRAEVTGWSSEQFTMFLTLNNFTPTGECATLIDDINSYTAETTGGVAAHYLANDDAASASASTSALATPTDTASPVSSPGGSASPTPDDTTKTTVETLIVETKKDAKPFTMYNDLVKTCGTIKSKDVKGATATFSKLDGTDAVQLKISAPETEDQVMYLGGTTVRGNYHAFTSAAMMPKEDAEKIFKAQRDKLRAEFQK